jgi:glyoxylase-like metal-dependent hydrolase (beta-lactamase superfamily II)
MVAAFQLAGLTLFERGWLSSNCVLFAASSGGETVLIDSGYCTHADQTLALVRSALGQRRLDRIVNTHLHSDHCGGNAALQQAFDCRIDVPSGEAAVVDRWDTQALTFDATQQQCPRFLRTGALAPGEQISLAGRSWRALAAPGHDPQSLILFEPELRILISADALWQNGFGVVFPEILGREAFQQVSDTLDLIEHLNPRWVIPGHGSPFDDVTAALSRARQRLGAFVESPVRHARHAAKVLLKFHLLEVKVAKREALQLWARETPYLSTLHRTHFADHTADRWSERLIDELVQSGVARYSGEFVVDI